METRTLPFQAPDSLAGTLAAYEARKRSSSSTASGSQDISSQRSASLQPAAESVYQWSLPSLHFLRWRPIYHLQAPSGWMNDPCAPGYDPRTGLYHLFFQWN